MSVASGRGETGVTYGPALCQLPGPREAFGLSGPQFIYLEMGVRVVPGAQCWDKHGKTCKDKH